MTPIQTRLSKNICLVAFLLAFALPFGGQALGQAAPDDSVATEDDSAPQDDTSSQDDSSSQDDVSMQDSMGDGADASPVEVTSESADNDAGSGEELPQILQSSGGDGVMPPEVAYMSGGPEVQRDLGGVPTEPKGFSAHLENSIKPAGGSGNCLKRHRKLGLCH